MVLPVKPFPDRRSDTGHAVLAGCVNNVRETWPFGDDTGAVPPCPRTASRNRSCIIEAAGLSEAGQSGYIPDMLGRILTSLFTEQPDRLPEPDALRALGALLVRLARADENYTEDERARIDRILARRYHLSPFEAASARTDAEELEANAPDTVRFTRALKEAVPYEDRMSLMEALWSVALSDGERDPREDAMIRVTADLLGINDRDRAISRQNVEKREE